VSDFLFNTIQETISKSLQIPIVKNELWDKKAPALVDYGDNYYSIFKEGQYTVDMYLDDIDSIHEMYIPGHGQYYIPRYEVIQFLMIDRPIYCGII
jgi:hypothetical protein